MTSDKPVCWGKRHSFKVERTQAGSVSVAEYLDDDAVAFARCYSPTPQEWNDWFAHAWQAGQDFEVRQRDEYDTEAEEPACPACEGECTCSDTVKAARARFAPDGEGAVTRKSQVTSTSYPRTAPAPVVTAPFPGLAVPGTENGADAAEMI